MVKKTKRDLILIDGILSVGLLPSVYWIENKIIQCQPCIFPYERWWDRDIVHKQTGEVIGHIDEEGKIWLWPDDGKMHFYAGEIRNKNEIHYNGKIIGEVNLSGGELLYYPPAKPVRYRRSKSDLMLIKMGQMNLLRMGIRNNLR